jgi:outer membrane protein assembly factor BamD (BamD/ComL family)
MKVPFGIDALANICFVALFIGTFSANSFGQADRSGESSNLDRIKLFINYSPLQKDVDIDRPSEEELKNCRLERAEDPAGYIVRDGSGRILRKFLDTSGNKKLDHLSYYKNGVEVYREIDNTGEGKPQEFRWLGSAGTRWGIDRDGDAKIDEWRQIGAEEVVSEAFEAVKNRDAKRFEALLLTPEELKSLKLGDALNKEVESRWQKAKKGFAAFCNSQRDIDANSQFANATNGIPSLVAKDSYGNAADLLFYDHASAVYQNSQKEYGNLAIGTVVYVGGNKWRLIELPEIAAPGEPIANGNAFYSQNALGASVVSNDQVVNRTLVEIHNQLDAIETKIKNSSRPAEIAKLEETKATLLEKLVYESDAGEQQMNTLMYAVDSIISAYQEDQFPDGIKFLDGLAQRIKNKKIDGIDYIKWRAATGRFNYVNMKGNNEDRDKANERWLAELMDFQKEFPASEYTAEALCYLAVNFDNEGKEKEAVEWYTQVAKRFPESTYGKRAKGALARLDGVDKKLEFVGQDLKGNKFNLQDAKWRDKVVVIHYWESRYASDELEQIQRLVEKYKEDVVFVGCNIDPTTETFEAYMKQHPEYNSWTQLHAPGSIESSSLALQLGVPSLPLVVIVGKKGELADPMVIFADLDRQIERQRRK